MYAAIEDFLAILHQEAPAKADAVSLNRKRVTYGLLPVGLKLHLLDMEYFVVDTRLADLVQDLGGTQEALGQNYFRREDAAVGCLVLPPVGNAETALHFLECVEQYIKAPVFGSDHVQIQVCSPGRLHNRHAGMLTLAFYLGSDVLRGHSLDSLTTTFSESKGLPRGRRITIYDGNSELERDFQWWQWNGVNSQRKPQRLVRPRLPFKIERTDVLNATSKVDIRNINLLATLLVHAQKGGYWLKLGREFARDFELLLRDHHLGGYLDSVEWVYKKAATKEEDLSFVFAIQEVMAYALSEATRINFRGGTGGLLYEVQELLNKYRATLTEQAKSLDATGGQT